MFRVQVQCRLQNAMGLQSTEGLDIYTGYVDRKCSVFCFFYVVHVLLLVQPNVI